MIGWLTNGDINERYAISITSLLAYPHWLFGVLEVVVRQSSN